MGTKYGFMSYRSKLEFHHPEDGWVWLAFFSTFWIDQQQLLTAGYCPEMNLFESQHVTAHGFLFSLRLMGAMYSYIVVACLMSATKLQRCPSLEYRKVALALQLAVATLHFFSPIWCYSDSSSIRNLILAISLSPSKSCKNEPSPLVAPPELSVMSMEFFTSCWAEVSAPFDWLSSPQ